ncbi:MAG: hypothetical protein IRY92_09390, partial [Dactylosporangium sp.]|nr:hypothetical protein [Dactylosporangium sp.]
MVNEGTPTLRTPEGVARTEGGSPLLPTQEAAGTTRPTGHTEVPPAATREGHPTPSSHKEGGPPPANRDGTEGSGGEQAHHDTPNQDMHMGGSIRPVDEARAWDWAEEAYERFRASDADVPEIANNLRNVERPSGKVGFTEAEIGQIKRHLLHEEHLLEDYPSGLVSRRFDASPDIAEAWIRLREGRPLDADLVLLEHELTESNYLQTHPGATYREAHDYANSYYNWEDIRPERTGEDYGNLWGRETGGNTGGLSEGPGRQAGGGVHLRVSGDEPPVGDQQG